MSLSIVNAFGLCTIQDLGRPGRMREGLPRGGALVPSLLARANAFAGNTADAAAIEVFGRLVVRAESPVVVGTDTGRITLAAGHELEITSEPRRVAYLALAGGIAAPVVLGSRSAHLSAGLGTPLRASDQLHATTATMSSTQITPPTFDEPSTIRVVAGPDRHAFETAALATLVTAPYRILPASNRVGTRLEGTAIARTAALDVSRPMVRGAIEVPRDGQPIVLGPEHPTTGGYPVIAVIRSADLDAFHATRFGGTVRFALAS